VASARLYQRGVGMALKIIDEIQKQIQKGDRRCIRNYRPISLLQVDYKILARIMANRFKKYKLS
jgi:hypothetical protein